MRRLAALALCLLFTGCLSDTTAPSTSLLVGTWSLSTVNGQAVPYTYPNGKQILDETFVITINGTYTEEAHYSDGSTYTEQGVITTIGGTAFFQDLTGFISYNGTWSATAMTQHIGSYDLGFVKATS